mmetsp:Transcript_42838/g.107227  ORF Transcript_42838/g.107227 Transcript_42838/m.107227 type:complete len:217 (+) Transcript_42838:338-988(+)
MKRGRPDTSLHSWVLSASSLLRRSTDTVLPPFAFARMSTWWPCRLWAYIEADPSMPSTTRRLRRRVRSESECLKGLPVPSSTADDECVQLPLASSESNSCGVTGRGTRKAEHGSSSSHETDWGAAGAPSPTASYLRVHLIFWGLLTDATCSSMRIVSLCPCFKVATSGMLPFTRTFMLGTIVTDIGPRRQSPELVSVTVTRQGGFLAWESWLAWAS